MRKIFTFLLALVTGLGSMWAQNPSGTCGDNLTWEFNTETGALTISGTGAMYNYNGHAAPWYAYKDDITSVSFSEGITTIGAFAFYECDNAAFTTVTIPEGVTALGVHAFYDCDGIQEITIPSTVTTIEAGAIFDCKAVNSITSYIASPTNLHGFAICGYKNTCTLYVPYASIAAYQAADCWKSIPHIAAIPGTEPATIKLNADFSGWEDTDAFTDNGDGTASWSISTLTAGEWYHFGVKVDDTWTSDNAAFDRANPSRVVNGTGGAMWFQADAAGEYTFTWEYATNTLTIGFPTVAMKGSWDEWVDVVNFTDNGDGTASAALTFEHEGYYTFKTVLGSDDWRGNGEAFKRNYSGAEGIVGNTDMILWVDAKGEYTFTWTYASNRIDIAYPTLPTVYLYLNGSADAFADKGDGTASYYYHFSSTGSYKEFKIRVGEDWRSNGQTFDPEHTTYDWINDNGGGVYMKIKIDAEADYTFTWTYVENKLEITHPVVPDYTLTTKIDPENPGVYYSTFYSSNYSYKLMDDGTEAFIAKISGGDLVLTMIAEGEQVIPKGTAVIFRKTGSSRPIGLKETEENNTSFDPADNDLRGVDHAVNVTSIDGLTRENCYVLSGTAQYGVGFYKINSDVLKQHKAYVKYEGGSNNAPKKMRFVYGQATGIEDVQGNNVQSTKVIENGVLYVIRDGKTYNAMGQVVK